MLLGIPWVSWLMTVMERFGFSSLADGNLIQITGGTNDASFNLDVALGQVY